MASTYSDLKIELIGTGDQSGTWGATTNTNLGTALEEAIVGRATANFTTDADLTITLSNVNTTQVARNYILNVTSGVALTATRNLIVPTIDKPYIVENNTTGSQSIVVKTSAGTGITVPTGKTVMVYANGTNVVQAFDYVPSVTAGAITDSGLTAGRVTYASTGGLLADSASLTFDGTTLSTTTVDATNLEVTNLKAKDGTAAGSIANSTGVVTIASSVLTTTDINGGTIDATAIGGSTPAAGAFTSGSFSTTLGVTGVATLTAQPILSSLTASSAVATDASKGLVSVTNTGTGNNVLATSPTITGATLTTAALNGTLGATTPSTAVVTSLTDSGLTSGRVTYASTGGLLADSANLTFDGTTLSTVGLTTTGNTILGNASTDTLNVGNGDLIKDASGNVGIGVTPSAWYTATGTKALQFGAGAFSSYSTTNFAMRQNAYSASGTATETYVNNGAASYYIQTAGAHSWATAPSGTAGNAITFTTAMTLDSSGNLGLGVTPSAWSTGKAIEVGNVGNAYWSAGIANAVLTSNVVYTSSAYKYANSAPSSQYQQYNGAHIWYTAASGTAGATITDFATAKMTLDASGGLKTLNTIGVGNATPSTSGAGITFPATQSASTDANTLDDYEEGTWTPNQGSGLTVVGAFSSSGTYTKVGRLVTVGGKIAGATSIALSAAGAVSSNLPFGPVITTHDYYMGSSTNGPNNISSSCLAYSTYIFATSAITASAAIYFTVTYMV